MSDSASDLNRLHDLTLPPEVSWWPPAPGCFVILALLFLGSIWFARRFWKKRNANAYRRAALRELASTTSQSGIAEILRRTALAIAPREMIAEKSNSSWLDWLAEQSPRPLPDSVREQLTTGIYGRQTKTTDLTHLRNFAEDWIRHHRSG